MGNSETVDERRRHQRRALRVTARISPATGQAFEVRTTDISVEGLGIVTAVNPSQGTTFKIEVAIPVAPAGVFVIEANTKVVHSVLAGSEGGFKIGLRFFGLSPAAESAVRGYVG